VGARVSTSPTFVIEVDGVFARGSARGSHSQQSSTEAPGLAPVKAAADINCGSELVVRGGVEPPTFRFSGGRSYQLSYLTKAATGVPGLDRREAGRRARRS
jgi:hypothetical protein